MGVYTPTGAGKKAIDSDLTKSGLSVDMNDEKYLKALINACSNKSDTVSTSAPSLQFFIVEGGAEGFLDKSLESVTDSANVPMAFKTTDGTQFTSIFDDSALIVVFDRKGKLISSAMLNRPIDMPSKGFTWLKTRAPQIFAAWDKRPVNLYFNQNFVFQKKNDKGVNEWHGISYFGLWIDDSLGLYKKGKSGVQIDLHKEEATNGCVFIKDPRTPAPPYDETGSKREVLSNFEPQFIRDIQKAIGKNTGSDIGVMRIVDVKNHK
jgi:hypothetical protein